MIDNYFIELGHKIRCIRTRKNMSQEELADMCGINKGTLSRLENGSREPAISTLLKVARTLNVSLPEIVDVKAEYYEEHTDDFLLSEIMVIMRDFTAEQQNDALAMLRLLRNFKGGRIR